MTDNWVKIDKNRFKNAKICQKSPKKCCKIGENWHKNVKNY